MITLALSDAEISALQKIGDAALRGVGLSVVTEVFWLQTVLKQAIEKSQAPASTPEIAVLPPPATPS